MANENTYIAYVANTDKNYAIISLLDYPVTYNIILPNYFILPQGDTLGYHTTGLTALTGVIDIG